MSISSIISNLYASRGEILEAIASKGVDVPEGSKIADCPDLISAIESGSVRVEVRRDLSILGINAIEQCYVVADQTIDGVPTGSVVILHNFKSHFTHSSGTYDGCVIIHLIGYYVEGGTGYSLGFNPVNFQMEIGPTIGGHTWSKEMTLIPSSLHGNNPIGTSGDPYAWADNGSWYGDLRDAVYYNRYGTQAFSIPGWHIPTFQEWLDVINYVCGTSAERTVTNDKIARLFAADGWNYYPEDVQRDAYGFGLRPCGYGVGNSRYAVGEAAYVWCSSGCVVIDTGYQSQRWVSFGPSDVSVVQGISLRLVKDE